MKIIGKLFVILITAAIAVIVLNMLVDFNQESYLNPPLENSDSDVSAGPSLLAPVQEQDPVNLQDQHLAVMLSIIGVIGLMIIVFNFMKWRR